MKLMSGSKLNGCRSWLPWRWWWWSLGRTPVEAAALVSGEAGGAGATTDAGAAGDTAGGTARE